MLDITIIMPFLNEGIQPLLTINSILNTCPEKNYEIILIHDDPNDPEFINELDKYKDKVKIQLIKNKKRLGVAESRNIGISKSTTPYVLLLDAHMRFINNNWMNELLIQVKQDNKSIFSSLTTGVDDNNKLKKLAHSGCDILFKNKDNFKVADDSILSPKWKPYKNIQEPFETPCVMGACYMMNREWINHIKQLQGLLYWGGDEPCMCLKSWLMGGSCKIIPKAIVGHIYRKKGEKLPWTLYTWYKFYNKMYLIYTLFPLNIIPNALNELEKVNKKAYQQALNEFRKNKIQIEQARQEYQKLMIHDIYWYMDKFNYEF
jgi:glycosyltransferase involved in cell wall biosynthesis